MQQSMFELTIPYNPRDLSLLCQRGGIFRRYTNIICDMIVITYHDKPLMFSGATFHFNRAKSITSSLEDLDSEPDSKHALG